MKFLTPLTLVAALVGVTLAYKAGAPLSACGSMFPSGHNAAASTDPLPYEFRLGATCYKANMEIPVVVTLKKCMDTYFEGLFVQARKDNNNMASFGVFDAGADSQLKTLGCFDEAENALTHTDSKHYMCKNFTWTAPATGMEDINFQMTIARNKATFWTEVKSAALMYDADCTAMATPPACQTYDETACMTEATTEATTADPSGAATLGMTSLAMLLTALTASFCLGY